MKLLRQLILLAFLVKSFPIYAETTKLNICEWQGYIMPWAKEFETYAKANGLDVELILYPEYLSSPEQIFNLVRAKHCDVITPTHNYFSQRNNQLFRSLMPLDYSKIPNYSDVFQTLKNLNYQNFQGENFAVPLLGGSYALAYNADKVPEPTSFDVLFDPKNKCKITLTKSQFATNFYLAILQAGYSADRIYNMDDMISSRSLNDKGIEGNLERLYKNVCAQDRFWQGEADFTKPELLYGTTYSFGVAAAQKQGANWKIAHNVRATVWLDTISFVPTLQSSPKKLAAAYMLANFMLSAPIQEKIHQAYGVVVVNKRAEQALQDLSEYYDETWLWQPLTIRTQGLYQILHQHAFDSLPKHYATNNSTLN
ncbi:PotD/PotF family extracellular solute-binding protein [Colwelliaceae bacterium MEBiC 14330]